VSRNLRFFIDEYYHLYNRGADKRIVFEDKEDHIRFNQLLYLCNDSNPLSSKRYLNRGESLSELMTDDIEEPLVAIGAYCLMSNHFHVLVKEIIEGGISKFMHRLSTAYTMYFNVKNNRTGVLFQGRFKAEHLDSDEYLKYIFSYIHLNPIKIIDSDWKENGLRDFKKAKRFLREYYYSSYLDYLDIKRLNNKILNKRVFPEYFPDKLAFEKCINEWLLF
jgi:putative transposase